MAALFFSQRKARGFNYIPRYYDPAAEEREERKKIVLGEKYRSPAQRARDEAEAAGQNVPEEQYVPGAFLREHIAARRGAHAADVMRRRRKKTRSVPVLLGMLALIILIVWLVYFK
jgi:hypothetical protein